MIRIRMTLLAALLSPTLVLAQEPSKVESPKAERVGETKVHSNAASVEVLGQIVSKPVRSLHAYVPKQPTYKIWDNFGLHLADADDVLRAQLELPADEGVVVVTVKPDSLAHDAGLKPNDILLKLAGNPVKDAENVSKILLGLTREAIQVKLIRQGKPFQLSVVGPEHGFVPEATEYWIGVPVSPVDVMLRAHLSRLTEVGDAGLVANDVVKESPAEKAGVKKYDILLYLGPKPLKNAEGMIAAVQATEGKPTSLILLRAGKRMDLTVTPTKRPRSAALNYDSVRFFSRDNPIQSVITPGYAFTYSSLKSEAEAARGVGETQQAPEPDGKIEVKHLLSGQKLPIDPKSIPKPEQAATASPTPIAHDPETMRNRIHLQLQTAKWADLTTARTDRLEAQMKELSTKLDEIRSMLEGLKKPETK